MSEYWKSTPNYWCKFCQTYVRDTKLERQKHEAKPKHQGNIQRSLRNLHKETEREQRDKQRAKNEVERLNGVVSGSASKSGPTSLKSTAPIPAPPEPKRTDPQERKRQLAQLAEMGVAIPEEYRKEMAMAGDWQTTGIKRLKAKEEQETKPDPLSIGVNKRKVAEFEDDDDNEGEGEGGQMPVQIEPKAWGSRFKTYSNPTDENIDLDALMAPKPDFDSNVANEQDVSTIKKEESIDDHDSKSQVLEDLLGGIASPVKGEKESSPGAPAPVIFKKRKAKAPKIS